MDWLRFIDIMGLVLGLLYLWLEYHANIWLWAVSVIMPIVHGYLYFAKGLYADFGMQFYYVAIAIYGYWCWRRGSQKDKSTELPITTYNKRHALASIATVFVLWGLIYWILITFTDSKIPVVDSFTTALSAVAMWALAKKYVEQWMLWFIVDIVCFGLYISKGIPFTSCLNGFYTVMAVLGHRKWLKLMQDAK